MTALKRVIILGGVIAAATSTATSTASAQYLPNFSGTAMGLAVELPVGKLDEIANTGYGISFRSGGMNDYETWQGRSSFTFDRFSGKAAYDNIQFVDIGYDVVHHSGESFYEFAGVRLDNAKYTVSSSNQNPFITNRNEQSIGLSGGVGLNFGKHDGLKGFVEFSATTAFTSGAASSWFPVRFGVRF